MSCSIAVPVAFAAPVAPVARRARTVARATPFVGTTSAFAARCACPPRLVACFSTRARSALGASSGASRCSRELPSCPCNERRRFEALCALRILEWDGRIPFKGARGRAWRLDAAKWSIASARSRRTRSHHEIRPGGSHAAARMIIRGPWVTSMLHPRASASVALERRFGRVAPDSRMRGCSGRATGAAAAPPPA
jgi:hypothetical protein